MIRVVNPFLKVAAYRFGWRKSLVSHLIEGSWSFQRKPLIIAEWMIATESGCCLRPLGIVR